MTSFRRSSRFLWLFLWLAPLWAQEVRHLTILHSNDLHAHLLPDDKGRGGFAYLASAVRHERETCAACLYLNAGDLVQGTPVSTLFHGTPVYEIGNLMGFDAACIGNHEFDYGWKAVERFSKIARYPLLGANAFEKPGKTLTGNPYVIKTVGGIRVAIIGELLGDLASDFSTPVLMGPVQIAPVVDNVRMLAHTLRDRSDLIVVLGHLHDDTEVDAILRDVPDVSIVVAGHSHIGYRQMRKVDDRVGVLVRGYGVELGRLDVDVDMAGKKLKNAQWKKIPIESKTIAAAPEVAREVAKWEAKVSKIVDVEIGESRRRLEHDELRTLMERVMRDETGSDFAFENSGGIRDVLPAGKILARNIWNIIPFDNRIVIGTFKGSQLPPAVTRGQLVDPDRDYKLAVSDFTAANQSFPKELNAHGLTFPKTGPLQRDAMIEWIRKQRVID